MPTALIVDESPDNQLELAEIFRAHGYATETAESLRQAREVLLRRMPEVAILDEHIDGQVSLDLLEQVDLAQVMEIYLMSNDRSVHAASRAMRLGVSDYLGKPVDKSQLEANLRQLERDKARRERGDESGVRKSARGLLVGESIAMRRLYRLIRKCAPSNASILITGESGVGKELVARTIHELSERSGEPMVAMNCSAVPAELMESELFGHRKGAFTGATTDHRGYFERATGGTLFLDEITEMDGALQAKLLRVLEIGQVRPVGSEKDIRVDVRIIAATNRDPEDAIDDGQLREDLYYRLAQFPMRVPPLRERGDDVMLLATHFLDALNAETELEKTFSEDVIEAFKLHDWPGNVRELKNAVMHGHLLAGEEIRTEDLPDGIPSSMPVSGDFVRTAVGTPLDEVERRHIVATLAHFDGDKKAAAKALGISLKTLYNRLNAYEGKSS